ncbi:MAG: nuclear transport factor 2 family protein [Enhydrobacter sp.]|nr:nuclear transport factor 2 family protein [Enhydrobacter sp.]
MVSDVLRWFELFKAFGRTPSPETYAAVFHPDGEVADSGMAAPTPAGQVREAIAHVLKLIPDLFIDMKRCRAKGNTVFVDAANSGTINGTKVAWDAVYRVHLKDGLVHRGRRFYDQATLFRALRPEIAWLPELPPSQGDDVQAYGDVVGNAPARLPFVAGARIETPDQKRTLAPEDLRRHLNGSRNGPRFEAIDWAGDDTLTFVEWRRGRLLGVDCLELEDGEISSMRRNFDTLGLLAEHDPSVTALRAALLSNAGRQG